MSSPACAGASPIMASSIVDIQAHLIYQRLFLANDDHGYYSY